MPIGIINDQYLSAVDPLWLDLDFDPRIEAIRRNREFLDIIKGMGGDLPAAIEDAKQTIYRDVFENPLNPQLDTTGATITGNGTVATPFNVSALPAASQSLVGVGDVLRLVSGVNVRVQTVPSAASFTAITVTGSSTTWTAAQYATIITGASESGSDTPTAKRWGITTASNLVQIIRSSTSQDDISQQSPVRTEVNGQYYATPYESIQCAILQYGKIMGALMMGQLSGTLFTDASPTLTGTSGNPVQTTRGLEQYIASFGVNDTVTTTGTVTLADMADMAILLRAARAPKDFMVVGSTAVNIAYSNLFKGLASSGAIQSLRLNVDGREVDFETELFKYAGFNFNFKTLGFLDNNEWVGTSGTSLMSIAKKGLYIPMGQIKSIGNTPQSYIKIAHLPEPIKTGSNRAMSMDGLVVETRFGNHADTATSGVRELKIDMSSTLGLRIKNPQAFAAQTVLA